MKLQISCKVACSEGATLTERSISFLRIQAPHVSEANIGPEQPDRHKLVPTPQQPIWLAPPCLKRPRKQAWDLSDNVNLSLHILYIHHLLPVFMLWNHHHTCTNAGSTFSLVGTTDQAPAAPEKTLLGGQLPGVFKRLSQTLLQHFASKNLLDQNFHIINYTIRLL